MGGLSGKWIVKYDPSRYRVTEILDFLSIQCKKPGLLKTSDADLMVIDISPTSAPYISSQQADDLPVSNSLYLKLNDLDIPALLPKSTDNRTVDLSFDFEPDIKRIMFFHPYPDSDKRWDTIHLPASTLFLGSQLYRNGYSVGIEKTSLPVKDFSNGLIDSDLIGLTLFEELISDTEPVLCSLSSVYKGIIAAGGPMVTSSPFQTLYHLPMVHLYIRGEAELEFPVIIDALKRGDLSALLDQKGLCLNFPGLLVLSDFDTVIRPNELKNLKLNIDFVSTEQLQSGLEINLSRGCRQGCIFCAKIQGKSYRKLGLSQFSALLSDWNDRTELSKARSNHCKTVSINDDDILQNPLYAAEAFNIIRSHGFRVWGIQSSINSFFRYDRHNGYVLDESVLELVCDQSLYVNDSPILWLGTDGFLKTRGPRLGKKIPEKEEIELLCEYFESSGIDHYHYWISSDHQTTWTDFVRELILIYTLKKRYLRFHILAHAPFLVPYNNTPLYHLLFSKKRWASQIQIKRELRSESGDYDFILAQRVLTPYESMNNLLLNKPIYGDFGFFDYLKKMDWRSLMLTVYNCVRLERLQSSDDSNKQLISECLRIESDLEELLSQL